MTKPLTYDQLVSACSESSISALSITTELEPAGGRHIPISPAKYVRGDRGAYGFETRFDPTTGASIKGVLIDGKGSQANRIEQAIAQAVRDGVTLYTQIPRMVLRYPGRSDLFDMDMPHRMTDGHYRAGTVDGAKVTEHPDYVAARNATAADLRPLLELSAISVLGLWDSTRKSHQLRLPSPIIGEVFGYLADQEGQEPAILRGGARVDPVGPSVQLPKKEISAIWKQQQEHAAVGAEPEWTAARSTGLVSGSPLGLGAIPPSLDSLGAVACSRIVRTHVLSFAQLRQMRFGLGPEGDATVRALIAAMLLAGLVRSYDNTSYRANCHLVEAAAPTVTLEGRRGLRAEVDLPNVADADAIFQEATEAAQALGLRWEGQEFVVDGDPRIIAAATADDSDVD